MVQVGIIGGAGYTGGELIRLLLNHPQAQINFVQSTSNADNYLYDVHTDLVGDTNLRFTKVINNDIDVLFLCMAHGASKNWLQENNIPASVKIIDLSQDFRLKNNHEQNNDFVYGLPELNKAQIKGAQHLANPGCFATAIQLALLPLAQHSLLNTPIHINAITGSTGAGQSLSPTSHYSWRHSNASVYKAFEHQHIPEILQSIQALQPRYNQPLQFIPQRGAFTRGILATVYTEIALGIDGIQKLYNQYYKNEYFVHIAANSVDVKQVVNTNKCLLHIQKVNNQVLITSVIDNLLKGASGQAVQNMNIMFGFDEAAGLKLKASAF